ncbi:Hypothetical predicted protein [Octopus vulgaris]|uniref:Uncharacterized protein n=1 Tax=Octopus vulgaris TaxID=6645 RepID=A0AA36FJD0_OCTVU|nr:Hypothetical predicted protein [Octopus vulgaris]
MALLFTFMLVEISVCGSSGSIVGAGGSSDAICGIVGVGGGGCRDVAGADGDIYHMAGNLTNSERKGSSNSIGKWKMQKWLDRNGLKNFKDQLRQH